MVSGKKGDLKHWFLDATGHQIQTYLHTSFECVRFWCLARSEALEKALLQPSCSHRYGFSPVWDLR